MLDKLLGDVSRERFKRTVAVFALSAGILVLGLALGDDLMAFVRGNGITSAILFIALFAIAILIQHKGLQVALGEQFSWGRIILTNTGGWVLAWVFSLFFGILLMWLPGGKVIVSLLQWIFFSLIASIILLRWPEGGDDDEEPGSRRTFTAQRYDDDDDEIELIS